LPRFKARARAVDLLGRQQIASTSTAITELFKNAHDAYADHVVADYFSSSGLLVVRDDGVGMTREEFEERWLIIGTESKVDGEGPLPPIVDPNKPQRPMLGNKGIGRLSIGLIGPQVLCVSRARRGTGGHDLVAAFVDWRLFEARGASLDEIEVPLLECGAGKLPSSEEVKGLVDQVVRCAQILLEENKLSSALEAEIRKDAASFTVEPTAIDAFFQDIDSSNLSLTGDGRGSHFFIKPADQSLGQELNQWEQVKNKSGREEPPELARTLANFANQMTTGRVDPPILTLFRHHLSTGQFREVPGKTFLFDEEEVNAADHRIHGRFRKDGSFVGTVDVFGEEHTDYQVEPPRGFGPRARCGEFEVLIAAIQGQRRESTLPDDEYDALNAKTNLFGGLYVYMDDVRVLPYGNTDFDWLNIELNRSKGAAYYYFSHRNMLGAVLLSRSVNSALEQKAGREGFVKNGAYRDLRALLQNLLFRLAADFFREGGAKREDYESGRKENEARRAREKARTEAHKAHREALAAFFERLEEGELHDAVSHCVDEHRDEVKNVVSGPPSAVVADRVLGVQRQALAELDRIEKAQVLSRGKFAFDKDLEESWAEYEAIREEFVEGPLKSGRTEIARATHSALETAQDRQAWFKTVVAPVEDAIQSARAELDGVLESHEGMTRKRLQRLRDDLSRHVSQGHTSIDHVADLVQSYSGHIESEADGLAWQQRMLTEIREATAPVLVAAESVGMQFDALTADDSESPLRQMAAIEQRALDLEDRLFEELQLVQLGMTVEVLSHELGNTTRGIREHLRSLKRWGDRNPGLGKFVDLLRTEYEHLDGFLTLFTPIQRRLRRVPVEFSGAEIAGYLKRLLGREIEDAEVDLVATKQFQAKTLSSYPSVYYPVFVNLVLNAIYWLRDQRTRTITLDFDGGNMTVSDTGPGVASRNAEQIFLQGWTRKPSGRGMGLPISRDVMRSIGGDVILLETPGSEGATFAVVLPTDEAK